MVILGEKYKKILFKQRQAKIKIQITIHYAVLFTEILNFIAREICQAFSKL